VKLCPPHPRQIEFIARSLPKTVRDERPNADVPPPLIGHDSTHPNGTAVKAVRIQD
jgi:hypothetical protein